MTLYADDLAYVHHVGFRAVPEAAARWLRAYLDTHRVPDGPVADLGCGSGVFAAGLEGTGRDVYGVDVSPAMIALAKQTAPRARFAVGTLHDAHLPPCAVVALVGEGLNYLPPAGAAPPLSATLRKLAAHVLPRGLLFFDVITGPAAALAGRRGFAKGDDWAVLSDMRPARGEGRLDRHITTFRQRGATYRRSDTVHRVRALPRADVERALRDAGFSASSRRGYEESARLPGRTMFVARRR